MKTELIRIGMFVRFGNQPYKGIVKGISHLPDEVQVQFEGEKNPEYVNPDYLSVFEGVSA